MPVEDIVLGGTPQQVVVAQVVRTILDIFRGSSFEPYTAEEIAEQINQYINDNIHPEELELLLDPDYLAAIFEGTDAETLAGLLNLPIPGDAGTVTNDIPEVLHPEAVADPTPPGMNGAPVTESVPDVDNTPMSVEDRRAANDAKREANAAAAAAQDNSGTPETETGSGESSGSGSDPGTGGTGGPPGPGGAAGSSPGPGEQQEPEPEEQEDDTERNRLIGILSDILFGENAFFTVATLTTLFTGGLTRQLLIEVFGTEGDRMLDFLNTVFPDTNAWERLAGNTGVGSVAGQDVNERMQIRQLAEQKNMKRMEVSATIQSAYIRNIPQMTLLPHQQMQYEADTYLANMRGVTEVEHAKLQHINAVMAPAMIKANINAKTFGHLTGIWESMQRVWETAESFGSEQLQNALGGSVFSLLNNDERQLIIQDIQGQIRLKNEQREFSTRGVLPEFGIRLIDGSFIDAERLNTLFQR